MLKFMQSCLWFTVCLRSHLPKMLCMINRVLSKMKVTNTDMNKTRSYFASFKQIHCHIHVCCCTLSVPETQEIIYKEYTCKVFSLFADKVHVHV